MFWSCISWALQYFYLLVSSNKIISSVILIIRKVRPYDGIYMVVTIFVNVVLLAACSWHLVLEYFLILWLFVTQLETYLTMHQRKSWYAFVRRLDQSSHFGGFTISFEKELLFQHFRRLQFTFPCDYEKLIADTGCEALSPSVHLSLSLFLYQYCIYCCPRKKEASFSVSMCMHNVLEIIAFLKRNHE